MRITDKMIDRIYVEQNTRDRGFLMPTHHLHPYCELYIVEEGACRFFIHDSFHELQQGCIILIPANVLHYTRYDHTCTRTSIFFRSEDLRGNGILSLIDPEEKLGTMKILQIGETAHDTMERILAGMRKELHFDDAKTQPALQVLLQEFFLFCSREGRDLTEATEDLHTTDAEILQAARYITRHYREPIKAADIAKATGYSPNYLSSRFRRCTGIGMHEYLVFTRLRAASTLLLSTSQSITDIALSCGFRDSGYFKDAFKKMYGMSPRAYRKAD